MIAGNADGSRPASGEAIAPPARAGDRVLLVSPVRNEEAHIEATARALAAQTRPPDRWIVVDDGSDDRTPELLRSLAAETPFMEVAGAPQPAGSAPQRDRLAVAAEARAFNWALGRTNLSAYTHIGKLDGDVELPHDYLERLLDELTRDPSLGLAGGTLIERFGDRWRRVRIPPHHVHGAVKLYTRDCLEAIGGVEERLGWDTIDETYARMLGFSTRSFPDIVARHHRHWGSAGGRLRGRARHGECAYIARYGPDWVLLRSLKVATARPWALSGLAFLYGYVRAAARSAPKVEDREFRRFARRELRARMLRPLRQLV